MRRNRLLDFDTQSAAQRVVRDDGFGVLTRAFVHGAAHVEPGIRHCIDDRGNVVERKSDAAETTPTARARIKKAEVQACRCFNARHTGQVNIASLVVECPY